MDTIRRRKKNHQLPLFPICKIILLAVFVAVAGVSYVYLKIQQHALGDELRQIERELTEVNSYNEVLQAQISGLTSRRALQKRLDEGFINLVPIEDNRIARLLPPIMDTQTADVRTASSQTIAR